MSQHDPCRETLPVSSSAADGNSLKLKCDEVANRDGVMSSRREFGGVALIGFFALLLIWLIAARFLPPPPRLSFLESPSLSTVHLPRMVSRSGVSRLARSNRETTTRHASEGAAS